MAHRRRKNPKIKKENTDKDRMCIKKYEKCIKKYEKCIKKYKKCIEKI